MAIKKHSAPPSCDYQPITGQFSEISFGVVEADGEPRRRLEDVIAKRYFPTEKPSNLGIVWPFSTAYRAEVLPCFGAPEHYVDPALLCAAYHAKDGEQIQHLAAIVTIRFPQVDEVPQSMRLHEAVETSRGFGLSLARTLSTALAYCFHVPARSWGHGVPHSHFIIPCRQVLPGSGFGRFTRTLIEPEEGRAYIDGKWQEWLALHDLVENERA